MPVRALTPGPDGALSGSGQRRGGLARLDKDGRWQTYQQGQHQRRPSQTIASARWHRSPDGALWVRTVRVAWRGSARTGAGRPIARPAPMAASQTISIDARGHRARTAPFGSGHRGIRLGPARQGRALAELQPQANTNGGLGNDIVQRRLHSERMVSFGSARSRAA